MASTKTSEYRNSDTPFAQAYNDAVSKGKKDFKYGAKKYKIETTSKKQGGKMRTGARRTA